MACGCGQSLHSFVVGTDIRNNRRQQRQAGRGDTMPKKTAGRAKRAEHGEKMIELRVRFWTDDMAPKPRVVPKNAWTSGVVRLHSNRAHAIKPARPIPFNSLMELGSAIEKALVANGIVLHLNRKMRKYCASAR
jgi:hypothetical protein